MLTPWSVSHSDKCILFTSRELISETIKYNDIVLNTTNLEIGIRQKKKNDSWNFFDSPVFFYKIRFDSTLSECRKLWDLGHSVFWKYCVNLLFNLLRSSALVSPIAQGNGSSERFPTSSWLLDTTHI